MYILTNEPVKFSLLLAIFPFGTPKYLNNGLDNLIMHTYLDNIKEFLKPNRWKILITIILSIPFIVLLAIPNITGQYFEVLIFLFCITTYPTTLLLDMLHYGMHQIISISSLIINYYIWACIYFSFYKILTKESMSKKDFVFVLLFFLILIVSFYIAGQWFYSRTSFG